MPTLGQVARTRIIGPIPGGGWLCTHAVVCWIWGVDGNHYTPSRQAIDSAGFADFLGGGRFTDRFLARMAMERGRRRFFQITPPLGSVVLLLQRGAGGWIAEHASVCGGNNQLYGYNQYGHFANCNCPANSHCHHNSRDIVTAANIRTYTVKQETAMRYFAAYQNNLAKWV